MVLNLQYTTQKKYDNLTEDQLYDKSPGDTIFFAKSSSEESAFNTIWVKGRCYGAVPAEGDVVGLVQLNSLEELPIDGKANTLYAYFDENSEELCLYIWDKFNSCFHKLNEKYNNSIGTDTVKVISYTNTTEPNEAWNSINEEEPENGQMMIVKDSSGGTVGYIYNKEESIWIAFSGNVLAQNVYFNEDITCAGEYTQVGNITKSKNGTEVIESNGKSLLDVMQNIFTKELQPIITYPSISISCPQRGNHEVGTHIMPYWTINFNPGSYTYGPDTGVTPTNYNISDSNNNSKNSNSGFFSTFTVDDSTNYYIKAEVEYSNGTIALTNLGKQSNPIKQIIQNKVILTYYLIKGYRTFFYGALDTDKTVPLTSNIIRKLVNCGPYDSYQNFDIEPIENVKRYVIAIPADSTRPGLTSAVLPNSLNAEVKTQYSDDTIVMVEGANGYDAVPYKVYIYEPASIGENEVHNITLG